MDTDPAKPIINTAESPPVTAQRRFSVWRQVRALGQLHPRRIGALVVQTYNDWDADGATRLGAALAYYTLFSIAPVLIVITGVVGIFVGQAAARAELAPWLHRFLSAEGASAAQLMLEQRVTPTGGVITTVIGLATLFLTTSAFVNELRQSINMVWRVHAPASQATLLGMLRGMFTDRLYGFLIALGSAVLIVLSFAVNTAITVVSAHFHGSLPLPAPLLHLLNFSMSLLALTFVFTLVYKVLPDAHVAWGDAWIGALATALLFSVGTLVLGTLVGRAGASPYGTAASVLALLAWVYYSAQVFFFGAEFTRIFATTYGGGIVPVHRSVGPFWHRSRPSMGRTRTPA